MCQEVLASRIQLDSKGSGDVPRGKMRAKGRKRRDRQGMHDAGTKGRRLIKRQRMQHTDKWDFDFC